MVTLPRVIEWNGAQMYTIEVAERCIDMVIRFELPNTYINAFIAGGFVRNLYFKQVMDIDLITSGDVDIMITGIDGGSFNAFQDYVQALFGDRLLSVHKTYEEFVDPRIMGVFKVRMYGIDIDLIVMEPAYRSIVSVVNSFNSPLNKFHYSNKLITNWGLPSLPVDIADALGLQMERMHCPENIRPTEKELSTVYKLSVNTYLLNKAADDK